MSAIQIDDQLVPIGPAPRFSSDDQWGKRALLKTEEAKRAAAIATGEMLQAIASTSSSASSVEKATGILRELSQGLGAGEAAPAFEVVYRNQPQEEASVTVTPTDYELPTEVVELLASDDDFGDDADVVMSSAITFDEPVVDLEPPAEDDVVSDPEVARLQRELAAANKKVEHERGLRVQSSRKDWEGEVDRVFRLGDVPLLSPEEIADIQADSRRGFLREAKAIADRNKVIAQRFAPAGAVVPAGPPVDPREAAWGTVPLGEPTASADSVSQQQRVDKARRSGRLANVLRAQIFPDE